MGHHKLYLSIAFAGYVVGVREVADKIWPVRFLEYSPGFFGRSVTQKNPRRITPSSESVTYVSRRHGGVGRDGRI